MTFKKVVEDFTCEHCGHENVGSGFTDHCEKCLWSKHVDIDPGDRSASCKGMMRPVDVEKKNGEYRILNKCGKCGFERFSPILPHDDFDVAVALQKKRNDAVH